MNFWMEESDNRNPEQYHSDQIKHAKIAIAVACISLKPHGYTGEQYARELSAKYQLSQQRWREKCENAQKKVLQLQQELVLTSLENDSNLEDNSQTYTDARNSQKMEVLFSPCRAEQETLDPDATETLSHHTKFLHSILQLKQISNSCPKDIHYAVLKTVLNSLGTLSQCISKDESPSAYVLRDCVLQVDKVLMIKTFTCNEDVLHKVQEFGVILVNKIMEQGEYQQRSKKEMLVSACSVSSSITFLCAVLRCTLDKVEMLSEHLREVSSRRVSLDVDMYENTSHLFSLCEKVLSNSVRKSSQLGADVFEEIQKRLDNALLHVSGKFPLYAHAIWKVQGILNSSCR